VDVEDMEGDGGGLRLGRVASADKGVPQDGQKRSWSEACARHFGQIMRR
jgi:hypothetical protein